MGEMSWSERGWLWLRLGIRLGLTLLVVLVLWKVGLPLLGLLAPFVAALVLALMFNPAIKWVQKKWGGSRRVLSAILLITCAVLLIGILAAVGYSLVTQVRSFLQNWQSIWSDALDTLNSLGRWLEGVLSPIPEAYEQINTLLARLINWLSGVVPGLLTSAAGNAGSFAMSLPSWAVSTVIFLMATYFISADYPHLRFLATSKLPAELRAFGSQVRKIAAEAFGGYVRAELILSFFVTIILAVGFFVLREPYALLLALLLGVMDFIPIIGSGTVMVPWAVIDVVLGNYGHAIGLMVVWGIIVLFRRVAEPKLVGDQTGLSPLASLVSIYVGMELGGVLGMVLGPVITLVLVNVAKTGVFDPAVKDVRAAVRDTLAILKGKRHQSQKPKL